MMRYFATLLILIAAPSFAANGYTAKNEKSIGAPPACSTTISSVSDPNWENINNPNYRVICILPGDYTSRGAITLSASGTDTNRRWLMLYSAQDSNTHPVNMDTSLRAVIKQLNISGNYWVIHRLTVNGSKGENSIAGTDNIFDSVLIENTEWASLVFNGYSARRSAIQNSVIRNTVKTPGRDAGCINVEGDYRDVYVVNNELYNCTDGVVAPQTNSASGNLVIENNDIYVTSSYYSGSLYSCTENGIDIKHGGEPSAITRLIHNRIWGMKYNNTSCAGTGASGEAIVIHEPQPGDAGYGSTADYVLVQDNIVSDSYYGVTAPNPGSDHVSVIGNILYNIADPMRTDDAAMDLTKSDRWEVYLNTIVNSSGGLILGNNSDVRCNLVINSGVAVRAAGSGAQIDYNAFYNTAYNTSLGGSNNIIRASATDANVTQYCYSRKLITGAEEVCMQNTRTTTTSPHYKACDPNLGSRIGVGINDEPIY